MMTPDDYWTISALREHLLRVVSDLEAKQEQRANGQDKAVEAALVAQDKAVQAALVAQEKAVQAALAASDKAVTKAEEGAQAWRVSANEWRGAMSDRERTFVSRIEHDQGMLAMKDQISLMEKWITRSEGTQKGHGDIWALVGGAAMMLIGAVGAIVAVVVAVVHAGPK